MTLQIVGKPRAASPRSQRRHYVDQELHSRQQNLLKEDLTPTADSKTYHPEKSDEFKPILDKQGNAAKEQRKKNAKGFHFGALGHLIENIERDISAIGQGIKPDKMDVDKLLYVSTYQKGFDERPQEPGKIYQEPPRPISIHPSLYQASFIDPQPHKTEVLNPDPGLFGKRNLLNRQNLTTMLVKDVIRLSESKTTYNTSYERDYKKPVPIREIPLSEIPIPKVSLKTTGRQTKYKRYGAA